MPKHILSYAITALLILTSISMLCFDTKWNADLEQRRRTVFPALPKKIRGNTMRKYFEKIDKYIADDIPFRGELISFAWKFFKDAGLNEDINITLRGKENWLFIGNSYASTIDKLQGKLSLHGGMLSKTISRYKQIQQFAVEQGADFALLIGPNKSSVYPEYLPPIIYPSGTRYITPGVKALEQQGILVLDPTELLRSSKELGLSYYRTDTHWNLLGGSIAASMLLERLGLPVPQDYKLVPSTAVLGDIVSIAGYTNFPLSEGDNYILEWEQPFDVTISKNGERKEMPGSTPVATVQGECISVSNKTATTGKIALVYADSFGDALSPFFNATFKEIYYMHSGDFKPNHVAPDIPAPDVIITIMVERNF